MCAPNPNRNPNPNPNQETLQGKLETCAPQGLGLRQGGKESALRFPHQRRLTRTLTLTLT